MASALRLGIAFVVAGVALGATQPAWAQTYDLSEEYMPQVGDRIRVHESDHQVQAMEINQGGNVQNRNSQEGYDTTYVLEVQAVREDDVTRGVRSYESFRDLSTGQDVPVAGVRVIVLQDDAGRHSYEADAGGTLPEPLRRQLDAEVAKQNSRQERGEQDDPFEPDHPVAVGETWDVPMDRLIRGMQFQAEDLDQEQSTASGTLEAVEVRDGIEWRSISVRMHLVLRSMRGMPCPEPMVFDVEGTKERTTSQPITRNHMTGSMRGPVEAQGARINFNMTMEGSKESERAGS